MKKKFRSFSEARKFVHKLGLKSVSEWARYCKSGKRPDDIPSWPSGVYKKDWKGWGDWLGTGRIASFNMQYRSFAKARKFVRKLGIKSWTEWQKYCKSGKKPTDIPNALDDIYNKEWKGYGNFFGTGNLSGSEKHKRYKSFEKARDFVRKLLLKNQKEWHAFCRSGKKPNEIPSNPNTTYKKEWKGMGDFLGYGQYHRGSARSFVEARKFVHKLGLKSRKEWMRYCKSGKKPDDIPVNVNGTYKKEWKGWGEFLGTGFIAYTNRKYKTFKEARKLVRSLKLKSIAGWQKYCKSGRKPDDIPVAPNSAYSKEWKGWGDYLGTGNLSGSEKHKRYKSFEKARDFVRKLLLKNQKEWNTYLRSGKKPSDIPNTPRSAYEKEWKGIGNFLGYRQYHRGSARSFVEARKFAHSLKLKWRYEWHAYCKKGKKPDDIPVNPQQTYKKEWKDWGDFLGTGFVAAGKRKYKSFKEARIEYQRLAKKYNLRTQQDFIKFFRKNPDKLPKDLPFAPWHVYSKDSITKEMRKKKKGVKK